MSDKFIKFEIVSPERKVFEADITQATIPTKMGEITVLRGHIPLVAGLSPGVIEIKTASGEMEIISVSGGFAEVLKNKIVILADTAERALEINMERSEEAIRKAEEIKSKARDLDETQFAEISAKLEKELARTKAVKRWKKLKTSLPTGKVENQSQ
jgi:F-type H+-transporting ATPase subunit epsilon